MSLSGKFEWYKSQRKGGQRSITFTLTNTNVFAKERFSAVIITAATNQTVMTFKDVELSSRKSLRFDYDSIDWDWCEGDSFAIVSSKGKVQHKWTLNVPAPKPGECPQCHGTRKCTACNGTGIIKEAGYTSYSTCRVCFGTGLCQACYVPTRQNLTGYGNANLSGTNQPTRIRQHKIEMLRRSITELQSKIQNVEMDIRLWQWKDMDLSCSMAYRSKLEEKTHYSMQLSKLQAELDSLERLSD